MSFHPLLTACLSYTTCGCVRKHLEYAVPVRSTYMNSWLRWTEMFEETCRLVRRHLDLFNDRGVQVIDVLNSYDGSSVRAIFISLVTWHVRPHLSSRLGVRPIYPVVLRKRGSRRWDKVDLNDPPGRRHRISGQQQFFRLFWFTCRTYPICGWW